MAKVAIDEQKLFNIGNAIRDKLNTSTVYKPSEMPDAIESIQAEAVIESKNISANGTYTAPSGVDGFSPVVVNVPNSYSASDEGKVVDSGALVAQTSRTIDENGTYDTTLNNEVVVDVAGGGSLTDYDITPIMNTSVNFGDYNNMLLSDLCWVENVVSSEMAKGWNTDFSNTYNSEGLIGAYGGFICDEPLPIQKVRVYLGRYSGQNQTLIATAEYLNVNNEWVEIEDLEISTTLPYPVNYFDVSMPSNVDIYGVRWIHKKTPNKTSGNTITYFGIIPFVTKGDEPEPIDYSCLPQSAKADVIASKILTNSEGNINQMNRCYVDLEAANTDVTCYGVIKAITNGEGVLMCVPYANSAGNNPNFYSPNNGYYIECNVYNYNTRLNDVVCSDKHIYALAIDATNKKVRFFLDGVYLMEKTFYNSGASVVIGAGDKNAISYIGKAEIVDYMGVVADFESDATVIANMQHLMQVFNIGE